MLFCYEQRLGSSSHTLELEIYGFRFVSQTSKLGSLSTFTEQTKQLKAFARFLIAYGAAYEEAALRRTH